MFLSSSFPLIMKPHQDKSEPYSASRKEDHLRKVLLLSFWFIFPSTVLGPWVYEKSNFAIYAAVLGWILEQSARFLE